MCNILYSQRKYYCYHQNAKYLKKNGNLAIAILDFSILLPIWLSLFQICDSKSCRSWSLWLNFFMSFVDWFIASYSYRSSNYCDSYLTLLKALAKSNGNLFAFKSDNYRYHDSWKSDNFRERAIKKEAMNWYQKGCKKD